MSNAKGQPRGWPPTEMDPYVSPPSIAAPGVVTRCRLFPDEWCVTCAEPDPHGDGRHAASEPGEVVVVELAVEQHRDCEVCRVEGACLCIPMALAVMTGRWSR